MTLSSQLPRNANRAWSSNSSGRRRRRSKGPLILGAAAIVVVAGGLYWMTRGVRTPSFADAATGEPLPGETITPTHATPPQGRQTSNLPADAADRRTSPEDSRAGADTSSLHVIEMGATADPAAGPATRLPEPMRTGAADATTQQTAQATPPPEAPINDPLQQPQQQPEVQPAAQQPAPTNIAPGFSAPLAERVLTAQKAQHEGRLVEARALLNLALHDARATPTDRDRLRESLSALNDTIVFGPRPVEGDPFTTTYTVKPGDMLVRIAAAMDLKADWRLLMRVNGIRSANALRVGQTLKVVRGPFHAVVSKGSYRLDLYQGEPDANGVRMYIRSFPVGLGETGSTPLGSFVVRKDSKLVNPSWRNPRTGEFFAADDPKNPLGEYWVGLDPADAATASHTDYGLHGTIEPTSIGRDMSMGCVRLAEPDIALLYEVLMPGISTVKIVP